MDLCGAEVGHNIAKAPVTGRIIPSCVLHPRLWFPPPPVTQANPIFRIFHFRSQSVMYFYAIQSLLADVAKEMCSLMYEILVGYSYGIISMQ